MENNFNGFYKLTIDERINRLKALGLFKDNYNKQTSNEIFDHIVENYISTYEVGMGIATNFLIDNQTYHLPMATEEPSVIAAANNAAKIIRANNGFTTISIKREMTGQIIFKNIEDSTKLKVMLESNYELFSEIAKKAHPHIYELGGGITDFRTEIKEHNFVSLYINFNTIDAMGANTINTILEAITNYLRANTKYEILMSILSNLAIESLVTTKVVIDPKTLKYGDVVANDIALASKYATIDPFRAATHNKGIMNGISALVLATGNDTRAIEAGAHAYAAISGTYQPLATWHVEAGLLIGVITIPLPLGTVGGSIGILPKARLAHKILNVESAMELMKVASALGLAQNFAALYALTTDGINKGHMRLHARNIALLANASVEELDDTINYMIENKSINVERAKEYLKNK